MFTGFYTGLRPVGVLLQPLSTQAPDQRLSNFFKSACSPFFLGKYLLVFIQETADLSHTFRDQSGLVLTLAAAKLYTLFMIILQLAAFSGFIQLREGINNLAIGFEFIYRGDQFLSPIGIFISRTRDIDRAIHKHQVLRLNTHQG